MLSQIEHLYLAVVCIGTLCGVIVGLANYGPFGACVLGLAAFAILFTVEQFIVGRENARHQRFQSKDDRKHQD